LEVRFFVSNCAMPYYEPARTPALPGNWVGFSKADFDSDTDPDPDPDLKRVRYRLDRNPVLIWSENCVTVIFNNQERGIF
jgi:hypothetical protein